MPTYPVNPGADAKLVWDGLEIVAVDQCDPDTRAIVQTATAVTVVESIVTGTEQGIGDGAVGYTLKSFWLCAADVTFVPKPRDRITDDAGTRWVIGNVTAEAFDSIYACRECVQER